MSEEHIKKDRSPNYPKVSLERAIAYMRQLYKAAGKAVVMPPVAVQAMGYSGTSGAALTTLAALNQYGLLDRERGEGLKVSGLGVRLLHPLNADQESQAKRECAVRPKVFSELISEGFLGADESLLCNHLIQSGFTADGARRAAGVFVENKVFANLSDADIVLPSEAEVNTDTITKAGTPKASAPTAPPPAHQPNQNPEDLILPLENGRSVRIPPMNESDYELMIETLKLWKRRIVAQPAPSDAV